MTQRWRGLQVIDYLLMRDSKKASFGNAKDAQLNWDGTRLVGPAPKSGFWSDCPYERFADPNYAYTFFDDFHACAYHDTGSPWTVDATGGTFLPGAGETVGLGGVGVLSVTNTDNNRINMKLSSTDVGGMFKITASSGKKLWFEARIQVVELADETMYVGLIDSATTRAGAADSGAANMTSGLYYRILTASPTAIDWACFTTTEKAIKANILANAGGTWATLGFKFDGVTTVTPWINGVVGTDVVLVDDANFPSTVSLTPMLYLATGEAVAKSLYVDWIKVVQTR